MYEKGIGLTQNYTGAAKWNLRTAEGGEADAQNNLGAIYADGHGVPQDYVRVHMWFSLAAAQDIQAANENRGFIAIQMTSADPSRAESMALAWRKKHP